MKLENLAVISHDNDHLGLIHALVCANILPRNLRLLTRAAHVFILGGITVRLRTAY
jgi:hypothetical protein